MALSPRMFKGTYAGAPSSVSTEKLFTSSHDTEEIPDLDANGLFSSPSNCVSPAPESEFRRQLSLLQEYSTNVFDFINKATDVLYRAVLTKCLLVVLSVVPLSMLLIGSKYRSDCPEIDMLAVYLSVGGCAGFLKIVFILLRHRKSPNYEPLDDSCDHDTEVLGDVVLTRSVRFTDFVLNIFIIVWFILGNVVYFSNPEPNFVQSLHEPKKWCNSFLYRYYFYMLVVVYILFSMILIYVCALCYFYYRSGILRLCKPRLTI